MKQLLVPELVKEKLYEFMKEHEITIYTIRLDPDEYAKYNKLISEVLLRGMQAVREFEEFDRYNDEIAERHLEVSE